MESGVTPEVLIVLVVKDGVRHVLMTSGRGSPAGGEAGM